MSWAITQKQVQVHLEARCGRRKVGVLLPRPEWNALQAEAVRRKMPMGRLFLDFAFAGGLATAHRGTGRPLLETVMAEAFTRRKNRADVLREFARRGGLEALTPAEPPAA